MVYDSRCYILRNILAKRSSVCVLSESWDWKWLLDTTSPKAFAFARQMPAFNRMKKGKLIAWTKSTIGHRHIPHSRRTIYSQKMGWMRAKYRQFLRTISSALSVLAHQSKVNPLTQFMSLCVGRKPEKAIMISNWCRRSMTDVTYYGAFSHMNPLSMHLNVPQINIHLCRPLNYAGIVS